MEEYIKTSKMRLKKIFINKSGQKVSQFVAKTPANIKAAAFMMGRAIARDGIIRTNFMGKASDRAFKENKQSLEKAMAIDMSFEIGNTLRKQGFHSNTKINLMATVATYTNSNPDIGIYGLIQSFCGNN
jgi:hypothetical protein